MPALYPYYNDNGMDADNSSFSDEQSNGAGIEGASLLDRLRDGTVKAKKMRRYAKAKTKK